MTNMQIVQIGPYPTSPDCIHGGVEASVYGLAQVLAKNHTVDVFDMPRLGETDSVEHDKILTIHRYTNTGRHNQDAVRRVADMARDIVALHPAVCHVHGTGAFSKQMYFALCQCGLPVLLTVHGLLHEEKKQALLHNPSLKHLYQYIVQTRDERALLNAAPKVIVDTAYVEYKLRAYPLRHTPEIVVVPQGIDDAYYNIKCNSDSNLILSVGAIGPRKGHIHTVRMFNLLRAKGIAAGLRIVGTMADKAYYFRLQEEIAVSPYWKNITIEVDVPRERLLQAYASAKLFVLHSREESQGIVFAEAMATGLPVVATNVGGIPYVVKDGECGLLCPYGDVKTMADMVAQLLTDEEKWSAFSAAARQTAKEYDWQKIRNSIEKTLNLKLNN